MSLKSFTLSIFLGILLLTHSNILFAAEEDECFILLNQEFKNDTRWSNNSSLKGQKDLANIKDPITGSWLNFSTYQDFQQNAFGTMSGNVNIPVQFSARKTLIAPIITGSNFVVSQVAGAGQRSNFSYPVVDSGAVSYGTPWAMDSTKNSNKRFREFVIYTNHAIDGKFLSCGVLHLTPLGGKSFSSIPERNYYSNVLNGTTPDDALGKQTCQSGFKGQKMLSNGLNFYGMKTNICTIDNAGDDFVRMEIIAIAWDNQSSYFNEYNIFPLQVQAMNDPSITSTSTLRDLRSIFLDLVDTKTCGSLVHTSVGTLPAGCNGQFSSDLLAFEKGKDIYKKVLTFLDSLFPKVEASLKIEGITPADIEASRGMMYSATFPFALYKKLESIEDKTFVNYLKWALDPNLEQTIQDRKDQGIVTSPYEDTFLQCGMNYSQREAVIKDFITKLRNPKHIDVNNLTYSDPKFGDCIIPYPDKTHIGKVVTNSFPSNQLLAEQVLGIYKAPPVSSDIQEMAAKENALHIEYQKTIDALTKDFQSGKLTASGMTEQIAIEKQKLDKNVAGLYKKIASDTLSNASTDMKDNALSGDKSSYNFRSIALVLIPIIIGILLLIVSFRKYKKK